MILFQNREAKLTFNSEKQIHKDEGERKGE